MSSTTILSSNQQIQHKLSEVGNLNQASPESEPVLTQLCVVCNTCTLFFLGIFGLILLG